MEVGEYGYKKPELVKVSEQIYECREKKRELELELSSEQFHYKYIPKRKKHVEQEIIFRLSFIIPLTFVVLFCVIYSCYFLDDLSQKREENNSMIEAVTESTDNPMEDDGIGTVALLLCSLVIVFGGYADIKMLIQESKMLMLLAVSRDGEKAMQFAKKHEINTFQSDEHRTKERLHFLQEEIASIEKKISALLQQRKKLLEKETNTVDTLWDKEALSAKNQNETVQKSKFTLKKVNMGTENASQLYEFYLKEEESIQKLLIHLDGKLQYNNKEIVGIDENFEEIKGKIIFSVIVFLIIIVIQAVFTGMIAIVTNFICLVGGLIYVFYVEKKWEKPILLYLIEHESDLTREYAFRNGIVPVRVKRDELLEEIEQYKKELVDLKEKRASVVF